MSALLFVAQQIHCFTFLMYEVFQSVRYHPVTHILLPSTPYLRLFNLIKGYCRGGPYRNFLFEVREYMYSLCLLTFILRDARYICAAQLFARSSHYSIHKYLNDATQEMYC